MDRMSKLVLTLSMVTMLGLVFPAIATAQHDGIKVHGAWTIEIHNPDGSLASRHEIQNALTPSGAQSLASILGGARNVGRGSWRVLVRGLDNICQSSNVACSIGEDPQTTPANGILSVTIVDSGLAIRLHGSVTVVVDSRLTEVETYQFFNLFSARTLPQQIPVVAGQVVSISVVISFS